MNMTNTNIAINENHDVVWGGKWPKGPLSDYQLEKWWKKEWGPLIIQPHNGIIIVDKTEAPRDVINHLRKEVHAGVKIELMNTKGEKSPFDHERARVSETSDTDPREEQEKTEQEEQSFVEDMQEIAGEIEAKELRERRDVFKAEIQEVGYNNSGNQVELVCDVPTVGKHSFYVSRPDGNLERSYEFIEILSYFGQNLHRPKAVEGMSLPVSYDSDEEGWNIEIEKEDEYIDDSSGFSLPSTHERYEIEILGTIVWLLFTPFSEIAYMRCGNMDEALKHPISILNIVWWAVLLFLIFNVITL